MNAIDLKIHAPSSRSCVGAGLKPVHYEDIFARRPDLGFFEIHAENFFTAGGPAHSRLRDIRRDYPLSVHGVCLSLGSSEPLDRDHLRALGEVVRRYEPFAVSEHLAWARFGEEAFCDLAPCPYDDDTLTNLVEHIEQTQNALGRRILLENPASYLRFAGDRFEEPQFLAEAAARSGCGLLLDVNNVHVSAVNHGFDAQDYLVAFPMRFVEEIHLAGFARARDARGEFLIDDHGGPVSAEVWAHYEQTLNRLGPCPTLIEWDNNLPDWAGLYAETQKARERIDRALVGLSYRESQHEPV